MAQTGTTAVHTSIPQGNPMPTDQGPQHGRRGGPLRVPGAGKCLGEQGTKAGWSVSRGVTVRGPLKALPSDQVQVAP